MKGATASPCDLKEGILLSLILCLAAIIYVPSMKGEFLSWDDDELVLNNQRFKDLSLEGLKSIFGKKMPVEKLPGIGGLEYLPIRDITFVFDYALWKDNPFGYHLTNVFLYVVNIFLVWLISLKLKVSKRIRVLSPLLFALHPANVESVAWISARKDLLYLLFFLLSFLFYLRFCHEQRSSLYILSLLSALFSILSKATAVLIPLIFAVYHLVFKRNSSIASSILSILPFFFFTWGVIGLVQLTGGSYLPPENPHALMAWPMAASSAFAKLLFPIHLSAVYNSVVMPFNGTSAILLFLAVFSLYLINLQTPHSLFFLLWVICHMPIIVRFDLTGLNIADRYLYATTIGYSFSLAFMLTSFTFRRIDSILNTIVAVCFAFLTMERVPVWRNSLSLWEDAVENAPYSAEAHCNLGAEYGRRNLMEKAEKQFHRALESPGSSAHDSAHILSLRHLGALHIRQRKYDLARNELEEAVSLYPDYAEVHRFLGALYLKIYNDKEKGFSHMRRSLELEPHQPGADELRKLLKIQ